MTILLLVACAVVFESSGNESKAVAAKVNGQAVLASEAEAEFRQAYGDRRFDDAERQLLLRAALNQVIDRRLVLAHFEKAGEAASAKDVDFALSQFERELKAQNLTLEQHCEKVGQSPDEIRRGLAWKASWKRYCDKQLTPQNLEKFFERNRRDFDGTQIHVSQILFKVKPDANDAAIEAAKDRAAKVKEEISAGKITFASAAQRDSQSPSRSAGGDIGWIERRRPMPEEFSRAAFSLKKGEVSEPLLSPFGVHLVTVLEVKPGTLAWRDVESELRAAVTVYLFRFLADRERAAATIEYSGD